MDSSSHMRLQEEAVDLAAAAAGETALPEDPLRKLEITVDMDMTQAERDVRGDNGLTGNRCSCLSLITPTILVRIVYTGFFLLASIVAWVQRENRITYFTGQRRSGCSDHDCYATEGVLTISFAYFLFSSIMFFSTVGTRSVHDWRHSWHFQWWSWLLKVPILFACFLISIFSPSVVIELYGKAAHFGAGVFLLIQLLSIIRFITQLNYKWCQTNFENRYLVVITVSVLAYSASTGLIIFMSVRYTACLVNITYIVITLVEVCFMTLTSFWSKSTRGFYMESGIMGIYIVILCWSAIQSDPETSCFKKGKSSSGDNWIAIVSFIVGLLSTTYATFSTGTDGYHYLNFIRSVVETENNVPYGYGFFHFLYAMGSMYFGMVFVGWDTHHMPEKWSIDVGWTSTWVHIGNEHLAVMSFVAVVIARGYEIGWLQQLLEKIFGIGGEQQENRDDGHHTGPEGSAADNGSPRRSRAIDPGRAEMEDNGPPPTSSSTFAEILRIPLSLSSVVDSDSDAVVEASPSFVVDSDIDAIVEVE